MSYGFQAYNSSDILQIDSSYSNYYLAASGSGTTNTTGGIGNVVNYSNNNAKKTTINFTNTSGQYPLIFIQCTSSGYVSNDQFYFFSVEMTSTSQFNILAISGYQVSSSSYPQYLGYQTVNFNWRAYLPQSILSPASINTGYGMNVYNESGNPVFSSNKTDIMKIQGIYDVYGAWWLATGTSPSLGGEPEYGLFQEMTNIGAKGLYSSDPWFLVNQSAVDQIELYDPLQTFGVWIGARTRSDNNRYLSGWCSTTSRVQSGLLDVFNATGTVPSMPGFFSDNWQVSSYNSTTGALVLSAIDRYNSGPINAANFPNGLQIVICSNSTYPSPTYGPYTVTNAVNGGTDSTMTLTIPTGLSIPIGSGYTTRFVVSNKQSGYSSSSAFGIGLMRVPGVIVLDE